MMHLDSLYPHEKPLKFAGNHDLCPGSAQLSPQDTTGFIFGSLLQAEEVRVRLWGRFHVTRSLGAQSCPKLACFSGWYKPVILGYMV